MSADDKPSEARTMVSASRRVRALAMKSWRGFDRASKKGDTEAAR
jgi:hypothetical protein